jgi:GGDEF domain-containing protein
MKEQVRATDIVARLGGDEFAILLPETGYEPAQEVIRKVRHRLLDTMRESDTDQNSYYIEPQCISVPGLFAFLGRIDGGPRHIRPRYRRTSKESGAEATSCEDIVGRCASQHL